MSAPFVGRSIALAGIVRSTRAAHCPAVSTPPPRTGEAAEAGDAPAVMIRAATMPIDTVASLFIVEFIDAPSRGGMAALRRGSHASRSVDEVQRDFRPMSASL